MKIVVLERHSVGTDIDVSCFERLGEVTYYRNTSMQEVSERVEDADIVIANKAPLNRVTLKNAKNLKLICEFATGFDNVELSYCTEKGIKVCNVRDYSTSAVAQHTFAMALYLMEHLPHYDRFVKSGQYANQDRFSCYDIPFCELNGKRWGIIGMGNIGHMVAKIATAFGCEVIFHSVTGKSTETAYEQVSFEELLKTSDILSIHCPLSDLTRNLIDKKALSMMKKEAILINVARGAVVDNDALYDALMNNTIAAAGLDVLREEPIRTTNLLSKIQDSNKLFITPHLAWASVEARTRLVEEVYQNIASFQKGKDRNIVNP